jgi:Protein of unknown function (DUF3999)
VKSALLLAFLLWQAATVPETSLADRHYLRYQRAVSSPSASGQTCAVIDPQIFPHAANSLKDLRLYQGTHETPYAITLSEPQQPDSDTAQIRNLGLRGHNIVFDVEMPNRPYTDVTLNLAGHDFLATATVSGTHDPNYSNQTSLGDFTLFDLTTQHLSRSTTLHLQETTLPYVHIELAVTSAPGAHTFTPSPQMVLGVTVPPSREAQSLYTTAAEATAITQRGHQSIATFNLPERIPIERLSIDIPATYKPNFSRDVRIFDHPLKTPAPQISQDISDTSDIPAPASENLAGTIFRVHLTQSGREIRQQQLTVPATLGSNMQSPATVEVAIDNGNDTPLPITAIRLETRQRKLCFAAPPAAAPVTLFYGDPSLTAPQYDYARLFSSSGEVHTAQLGPEQLNPIYRDRPDQRPLTERRPHLLWIVLLAVICILATVAIRSSKTIHH